MLQVLPGHVQPWESSQTHTWWVLPCLRALGVSGATEATPRPHPHQDAGAAGWMRRQRAGVGGTLPYFLGSCLESGRQSQHLRGPLQSWALGSSAIHIPNLPSIPIPGSKFGNQQRELQCLIAHLGPLEPSQKLCKNTRFTRTVRCYPGKELTFKWFSFYIFVMKCFVSSAAISMYLLTFRELSVLYKT